MNRTVPPIVILFFAVFAFGCSSSDTGRGDSHRTAGPVADGPLMVGCWAPMKSDSPDWVFPMIYHKWPTKGARGTMSVEEYAQRFVDDIEAAPPTQPIWLQTHAWLGDYKPGWDRDNVIAHEFDATPWGSPGMWPDRGAAVWRDRMERFLAVLKKNDCRLDMWPLDHETGIHQWAHNFQGDDVFRRMVLDMRWKTDPVEGLGVTGSQLLDPAALDDEQEVWTRRHVGTGEEISESKLAYDHVVVLGLFVTPTVLERTFADPIRQTYPQARISDYKKYHEPIAFSAEKPYRFWGTPEVWTKLHETLPEIREVPGVGNCAAPPLYGQMMYRESADADPVPGMLALVDRLIARYGGPEWVTPWICPPNVTLRHAPDKRRAMTPDQYERLMVGLTRRGVRRLILWNSGKGGADPEVEAEMLSALKKAYEVARKRRTELAD